MDLVTITGEILHGKLLFLCSVLYMVLRGYVVKVKVSVDNFKDLIKFPFSKVWLKKKKKKKNWARKFNAFYGINFTSCKFNW